MLFGWFARLVVFFLLCFVGLNWLWLVGWNTGRQALVTPGGTARLLVRSCQALSAADLALSSLSSAADVAGGIAGGAADAAGGGNRGGAGGVAFLSGGAEGGMTAALRKLHELGPSLAGRCVGFAKRRACHASAWLIGARKGRRRMHPFAFERQNKMYPWVLMCICCFLFLVL